ncbi:MAG: tetratricopeptide repeat protein, partial [Polynucleobacter sp.]|nr:tetratricopeptide repeat protein [Polynucleobacter sp.]
MPRPPRIPKKKVPAPIKLVPRGLQVNQLAKQGLALHREGRFKEAQIIYEQIIKEQPDHFDAIQLLGALLVQTENYLEAIKLLSKALQIKPDHAPSHYNLGGALKGLQRFEESIASFNKAISIKPDYLEAYSNKGHAFVELKKFDQALKSYDQLLALNTANPEAHNNRGNILFELKQFEEAITSFRKAILNKPDYAEAYNNLSNALRELNRFDEAIKSCDKAIEIRRDYATPYFNRGTIQKKLKRLDEARTSYQMALDINPDYEFLFGMLQYIKMLICDWHSYSENRQRLSQKIRNQEKSSNPFPILGFIDSPAIQKDCAAIFVSREYPQNDVLGSIPKRLKAEKIRLGYFSADYHDHATAHLMAEFFESHHPDQFELIAFSFGPDKSDQMRTRLSKAFDRFIDVRNQSDQAIAQLSRELRIDIAIDLKGFTTDCRLGIFAHRAAPIQVNYLGYPGTMSAEYIDYIIADKTLIPPHSQHHYSEKIVYLPHSYQVNDRKRVIADKLLTRSELGLPEQGFVFACFNNNYKINPDNFDRWMRILKVVDGSVLWLFEDNPWAAANLKKEAEKRGVNTARLVFAKRMPLSEHLARHRQADLFLDTLPCNAHTTCSDALWAGLPVLTLMGESFASRVAASLLNGIDLPELITTSPEEYEALAIELATNSQKLAA